jgi:succinoglycan biosynthesis protein ExoO
MTTRSASSSPLVSVIMANYCGADYLPTALASLQAQTHADLEILVVDDASVDDSVDVVAEIARHDPRIRLLRMDRNGGPARARNHALAQASGDWIAIVDADDQVHPERFERLLLAGAETGADILADDLLHFYEDGAPVSFLLPEAWREPRRITARDWILGGSEPGLPALGYLKPMIRTRMAGSHRYDETMRIGEDFEFIARLLLDGAAFIAVPQPWYLYRRHASSTSHRLTTADLECMIGADERMRADYPDLPAELQDCFELRRRDLLGARDFSRLVDALKRRDVGESLGRLLSRPGMSLRLADIVRHKLRPQGAAPRRREAGGSIEVPDYVPPTVQFSPSIDRSVWERLVNAAFSAGGDLALEGTAGRYAAGFVPRPAARLDLEAAA